MPTRLETGFNPNSLEVGNKFEDSKLPHGVAPETYGLLLYAHDHKEILDIVDSLDRGKRVRNPVRNLLVVYFSAEVSGRDLSKSVGGDRFTNGTRMLEALDAIWQNVPPEIQSQYSREKAVRLKESPSISPRQAQKRSDAARALWEDQTYREKVVESLKANGSNPKFIQRMRDLRKGKSPMEGKKHTKETKNKISRSVRESKKKVAALHNAQGLIDHLQRKSGELARRGISQDDIDNYYARINDARNNLVSAITQETIDQTLKQLDLLIGSISRKLPVVP